jgi:hypothetical protein
MYYDNDKNKHQKLITRESCAVLLMLFSASTSKTKILKMTGGEWFFQAEILNLDFTFLSALPARFQNSFLLKISKSKVM